MDKQHFTSIHFTKLWLDALPTLKFNGLRKNSVDIDALSMGPKLPTEHII